MKIKPTTASHHGAWEDAEHVNWFSNGKRVPNAVATRVNRFPTDEDGGW